MSAAATAIKECFCISMSFLARAIAARATLRIVRMVLVVVFHRGIGVFFLAADLRTDHDEEHGDQEEGEERRRQHPADHAGTDRVLARRTRTVTDRERQHAENERER